MSYFRKLDDKIEALFGLLRKDERWLILLVADPDALASAMALKRILAGRVHSVALAQVNEISRPDNLAMVRFLRIPSQRLTPPLAAQYDRFALVDSQPHHHPAFADFKFSVVIDHHPRSDAHPVKAEFQDISTNHGANSTVLTEYLYNLKIRPGMLLATALIYGIKTDTQSFERHFYDADIKSFRYLTKFANQLLLRKIARSEFRLEWLKSLSLAFKKMQVMGEGMTVYMGEVDSPDILVVLADFFLRVHGIAWNIVSGISGDKLVVVLRGDGLRRDMGKFAARLFGDVGSAGGHKGMARAEIPLGKLGALQPQQFVWQMVRERKSYCKYPRKTATPVSAPSGKT